MPASVDRERLNKHHVRIRARVEPPKRQWPNRRTQPPVRGENGRQLPSQTLGSPEVHNTDFVPHYTGSRGPETPSVVTTHHRRHGTEVCPKDNIRILINGVDCPVAIDTLGHYLCYKYEHRFRSCCEKCVQLRNHQKPGCEYGDHSRQCQNLDPYLCYERQNREICCETCPRLKKFASGTGHSCEYGDMTPRCKFINPSMCYRQEIQRLCCYTCPILRNQQSPECLYGDRDGFLCAALRMDRSRCYREHTRQICCNACSRLRLSVPDCAYGDHRVAFNTPLGAFGCEQFIRIYGRAECKNPTIKSRCCASCYGIP